MGARGYGISLRVFNSQGESMRGITTKTNNGPGFNVQNSHFFVLVLTDRRNLSGTRPKSGCTKSQVVDFRSQPQDMPLPKAIE